MNKSDIRRIVKEEIQALQEDSYHSGAIDDFIKKNAPSKMPSGRDSLHNLPRLKVFGDGGDTKFLNVTFDALREISKILKKMKT